MKNISFILSYLTLGLAVAFAESPPTQVPATPRVSATKALELANGYVAKLFPVEAGWYCQSANLIDDSMRPVRPYRHWDLVYRHAGAERHVDAPTGKETFGDFHVYVTMDGDVTREGR